MPAATPLLTGRTQRTSVDISSSPSSSLHPPPPPPAALSLLCLLLGALAVAVFVGSSAFAPFSCSALRFFWRSTLLGFQTRGANVAFLSNFLTLFSQRTHSCRDVSISCIILLLRETPQSSIFSESLKLSFLYTCSDLNRDSELEVRQDTRTSGVM